MLPSDYHNQCVLPNIYNLILQISDHAKEPPSTQISPLETLSAVLVTSTLPGWICVLVRLCYSRSWTMSIRRFGNKKRGATKEM
jgi:hypothetical protein